MLIDASAAEERSTSYTGFSFGFWGPEPPGSEAGRQRVDPKGFEDTLGEYCAIITL